MELSVCEIHLVVSDLDASEAFYTSVLGFSRAFRGDDVCFLWTGSERGDQIGLWRVRQDDRVRAHTTPDTSRIQRQHVAFGLEVDALGGALRALAEKGVAVRDFEGREEDLSVHAWVPAVSAYLTDPDGHALELYARLPDPPEPGAGVIPFGAWERQHGRSGPAEGLRG